MGSQEKICFSCQYDTMKERFYSVLFPPFFPNNRLEMIFFALDPNIQDNRENKVKLFPPIGELSLSGSSCPSIFYDFAFSTLYSFGMSFFSVSC